MAPRPTPSSTSASAPLYARGFASLFNNDKYSDVTIFLGQSKTKLPVHGLILSLRSPYFDDALKGEFVEGKTREFTFAEDSPHALWRVFQYIYTEDYSMDAIEALESEGDDLELLKHPRVYALADMFRMNDLKELCCRKFENQLQQHWISDTFTECIREVYDTSSEMNQPATRAIVVRVVVLHKKELMKKRPFQELVREVGDFAVDLTLALTAQFVN